MLDTAVIDFLAEMERESRSVEPSIPFSEEEYRSRLAKLQAAMAADGIDTLFLTSPEAQCWLHGLSMRWYKIHGPSQWRPLTTTVVRQDAGYVVFEGVEHQEMLRRTSVATDVKLLPRYQRSNMLQFIIAETKAMGWLAGSRVGLELYSATPNPAVSSMLQGAIMEAGGIVVDGTLTARRVRRTKSAAELDAVRKAAAICDAGLLHLAKVLRPGMTELEAHGELIKGMNDAGGEPAGLHEVVFVGLAGLGVYHEISGRRVITEDDFVDADPCGVYHRYHANRSQLYAFREPPDAVRELIQTLSGAFDILTAKARPGARVGDVCAELFAYYADAGVFALNENIWIGGYELGIAFPPDWVGEWQFTVVGGENDDRVFESGMVLNFESICGIGLLDTFVITDDATTFLSQLPHDVMVVGR